MSKRKIKAYKQAYKQLLESFILTDQTLMIKKTYALTILSEADAINSYLSNDTQCYPHAPRKIKQWKNHLNKLINFKNKYLFEKIVICKIQDSTINKDSLLFSLPQELLEYVMSFVDVSDVEPWREQIIEIPTEDKINMILMGEKFVKFDQCLLS